MTDNLGAARSLGGYDSDDYTAITIGPAAAYRVAQVAAGRSQTREGLEETLLALGVLEPAAEYHRSLDRPIPRQPNGRMLPRGGVCRHDKRPRVCRGGYNVHRKARP